MSPDDFRKYLSTEILSEKHTLSYRNVARVLKVHANAAKCMLYEFHEQENKKRPDSVHATYLLAGTKKRTQNQTDGFNGTHNEDEAMPPSSPPPFTSSMLEPSEHGSQIAHEERLEVPVRVVTLVREEQLEEIKEHYESITSIHIYSLSPHRIQDLVTLTDIGRGLYSDHFVKEDPLIHNKTYGVIQNPQVRRRKGKRPVIPDVAPSKFKPVKEESKPVSSTMHSQSSIIKKEEPVRPGSSGSTTSASTKGSGLKRDNSDFFKKAFGKAGTTKPTPKLFRNDTDASTSAAEDTKMTDLDEGESEDEALFLDTGKTQPAKSKKRLSDVKKEREDKAAKLRKMMDSDDDDEEEEEEEEEKALPNVEDASHAKQDPITSKPGGASGEDGQDGDVAWSDSETEKQRQKAPGNDGSGDKQKEEQISTEPRRRRGKRKVVKKKTTKDEDGYLVTKEEAVWESFSESETEQARPVAKKAAAAFSSSGKMQGSSQAKSSGRASGKGGAAAKGGGNIMNFFGKK